MQCGFRMLDKEAREAVSCDEGPVKRPSGPEGVLERFLGWLRRLRRPRCAGVERVHASNDPPASPEE